MRAGISPNTIPWEREAIEVFAKTRNAASYRHWMQENLCQIDPRFDFEQAFRDATTQAGTIHFNLDGFNLLQAWRLGQRADPYAAGVTNWEFVRLLTETDLRSKAIFWQNGQQVPLACVLKRAGVPPNAIP